MPAYDVEIKVTIRVDTGARWYAENEAWGYVTMALDADGRPLIPDDVIEVMSVETIAIEPVVAEGDLQYQEDLIERDARQAATKGGTS